MNYFGVSKLELTLPLATTLEGLFSVGNVSGFDEGEPLKNKIVEEIVINCQNKITSAISAFGNGNFAPDDTLKKITLNVDLSDCTQFRSAFQNCRVLEIIDGYPLNLTNAAQSNYSLSAMFTGCSCLREVRFAGDITRSLDMQACPLSKESLLSVASCLSSDATGMTLSLKKTAVDTAFETAEGAADGSSSAEWTELVDSKSNWTISLV